MLYVVIPCYNEEKRLNRIDFLDALATYPWLTLCLVDDCSTDNTSQIIQKIRKDYPDRIYCLKNNCNSGKAASVRNGIMHGLSESPAATFGYLDADLSTPFSELACLYEKLLTDDRYSAVIGSRINSLGRTINKKNFRHYIGRVFATFASIILQNPVYDTQCGAKVFSRKFAEIVFRDKLTTNWCFDIELLIRYQKFHNDPSIIASQVLEYPLNLWIDIEGSKVRLSDIYQIANDLLRLFRQSRKY